MAITTVRPKSLNDSAAGLELDRDKISTTEPSDTTFAENMLRLYDFFFLQLCHTTLKQLQDSKLSIRILKLLKRMYRSNYLDVFSSDQKITL